MMAANWPAGKAKRDPAQRVHRGLALAVDPAQVRGRDDVHGAQHRSAAQQPGRVAALVTSRVGTNSAAQVRQHGQHAAVVLAVGVRSSLEKIEVTCFSTARSVTTSASAIAALERPSAIRPEHLALARGQRLERILAAAAAEQQRDDLGIERRAAAGDAAHRVGERVHVGHAVLEQVAGALGGLRQQLERVGLLDVLARARARRSRGARRGCGARRAGPRRCGSAACGRRPPRRRACGRRPCAAGPRRRRPGRRPRSPTPRAAARDPRAAARSRRR